MHKLICENCKQEFQSINPRTKICKACKVGTCVVCGKQFNRDWPYNQKTCSKKCRDTYIVDSGISKRGAENRKAVLMDKYGVDNVSKLPEVREKIRAANVKTAQERSKQQQKSLVRQLAKYNIQQYHVMVHSSEIEETPFRTLVTKLLENNIELYTGFTFYDANGISYNYDLKIKNADILINIDSTDKYAFPTYSNSNETDRRLRRYHLNCTKFLLGNNPNYRCIHVFDWDNLDKIVNLLKPKKTVYARNCKLVDLDIHVANNFLDAYHLQNKCRGAEVCLGLIYDDQVVQVMTFGKSRYNKNYEWELLRLCSHPDYKIVGGASKMFSWFEKNINPKSIVSYCDIAKFTGDVYYKLGMTLDHISDPAKIWSKGTDHITDNLLRQRGFDQIFGTNFGKGTSNNELMVQHGWRSVYDCGQMVFVKTY